MTTEKIAFVGSSPVFQGQEGDSDENSWARPILTYIDQLREETTKICKICGIHKLQTDFSEGHGVCKPCIATMEKERRHKEGLNLPFNEAKKCPLYLGVHIAERVLSSVFKNVTKTKWGNPGYDFVCGKGFKIDVKSACFFHDAHRNGWRFFIKKNKTADYFLCLAFDNRESLNPQHLWLIPGDRVNQKNFLDMRASTFQNWMEYELPLEKVEFACNLLKGVAV